MCGRYASFLPPEFLARLFTTMNPLPHLQPTWNLAPTDDATVIRLDRKGARHLDVLRWGLIPYFSKELKTARRPINARSDTGRDRVCSRQPSPNGGAWSRPLPTTSGVTILRVKRHSLSPDWTTNPLCSAAFGNTGSPQMVMSSFATIATEANRQLSSIQPRMPVIIELRRLSLAQETQNSLETNASALSAPPAPIHGETGASILPDCDAGPHDDEKPVGDTTAGAWDAAVTVPGGQREQGGRNRRPARQRTGPRPI
jgi:hypothetical protein